MDDNPPVYKKVVLPFKINQQGFEHDPNASVYHTNQPTAIWNTGTCQPDTWHRLSSAQRSSESLPDKLFRQCGW